MDFENTFSATMRATSFRTMLALSASEGMKIEHMDVSNAFTQAEIDNDIWVECPDGFGRDSGNVFKLKKALYGTKQASHLWQCKLFDYLKKENAYKATGSKFKFKQCLADSCLFEFNNKQGKIMIGVYVDDLIIAHNNKEMADEFIKEFCAVFTSKHLGPLSFFLGVAVDQHSDGSISINQTQYIRDMVEKYNLGHEANSIHRDIPHNVEP